MKCSYRAGTRLVRALVAGVVFATPALLAGNAAAAGGVTRIDPCRESIGIFRVNGRSFDISCEANAAREIAEAFRCQGYSVLTDHTKVIVRLNRCATPVFFWTGLGFYVDSSWRGDCLIIEFKQLVCDLPRVSVIINNRNDCDDNHRRHDDCRPDCRVDRHHHDRNDCDNKPKFIPGPIQRPTFIRTPGYHIGTFRDPVRGKPGVKIISASKRDDPNWGRRIDDDCQPGRKIDRGFGRNWDTTPDHGFRSRWSWTSARKNH